MVRFYVRIYINSTSVIIKLYIYGYMPTRKLVPGLYLASESCFGSVGEQLNVKSTQGALYLPWLSNLFNQVQYIGYLTIIKILLMPSVWCAKLTYSCGWRKWVLLIFFSCFTCYWVYVNVSLLFQYILLILIEFLYFSKKFRFVIQLYRKIYCRCERKLNSVLFYLC